MNSQLNAGKANNSNSSEKTELIEREMVEGSPYWIIGDKKEGYMLTFGKYQISEKLPSKLDVVLYLDKNKYDIILKTILAVGEIKIQAMEELKVKHS